MSTPMAVDKPNRSGVDGDRILVVDDDLRMRRLLQVNLEQAGYRVCLATDCAAALDLVQIEPPDLILLDIMMPVVDGLACLKRLRESTTIPVILLTARIEERVKVQGMGLGANDYCTKPFELAALLSRVRAVLHGR